MEPSGGSSETPESIRRRKEVFARFAKLNARHTEQRRLRLVLETDKENQQVPSLSKTTWHTQTSRKDWDISQHAYIEPYVKEFQGGDSPKGSEKGIQDESADADTNCDTSSVAESDISRVASLKLTKTRSCRTSVFDFDRTSTVRPPTEVQPCDDYTSTVSVEDLRKDFFSGYRINKDLPIYSNRSYLINSINSYSVVIIEGATGCGKTTQVPTYILEDAILERKTTRSPVIYVTQPRKIAARSIAARVCAEHGWELGSIVGYQVGLDKNVGPQTVLVYCTAGVLLQKLIQEKSLKNYTHIVIDEAHERDADTDLLMMMIRTLMRSENLFFHLIIMSATMDMNKLKTYFTFKVNYGHKAERSPSICKIGQEKKPTNIQVIYFDKLRTTFQIDVAMPIFDIDVPEIYSECYKAAVKILIDVIPHLDTFSEATKSTLVFLPGLGEIQRLHSELKPYLNYIEVIPLHSCLSVVDQNRVFSTCKAGYRKVILATNIAESSITVPDVGFIIDFCLTKTLMKDNVTNFPTLKLQWSTVDKSIQRAGRTGRCCPGKVFRMVSSNFYKDFGQYAEPELLTAPLELSVLRIKNFQMGEIKALFALVMDPPPLCEIRTAVLELKQIGALSSTYDGQLSDIDGDLTELGKVISSLPIDVHLSKLIVIASVLDVLEDAIIVAACLSTNRSVVKHQYGLQLASYLKKIEWANGSYSDLFVSLDVYKEYTYLKEQNKRQEYIENYCYSRNLDERKLHDVSCLIVELKSRLEQLNVVEFEQPNRRRNRCEDELMLKIAFCASFYPNFFLTQDMDSQDISRSLYGFDPVKTVIIHNLPMGQAPLYKTQIMNQLRNVIDGANIEYVCDFTRALLIINHESKMKQDTSIMNAIGVDGIIQPSLEINELVYILLKWSDSERLVVREFKDDVAMARMDYYKQHRKDIESKLIGRLLPPLTKLVVNRAADNNRLIRASDTEYRAIQDKDYYLEVDFNEDQDEKDMKELYRLEYEDNEKAAAIRNLNEKKGIEVVEHHIYKDTYRTIRGPTSPIQMSFRPILEKSRGYCVDIDSLSVNSILLEPNYQVNKRQMLVAASICQNRKNKIVAKDTTLMPNIRGLPTIMALLFAQYYRLVYNNKLKCLAGAIFGLGWDDQDKPIDDHYEVDLDFDVHITQNDIGLINKSRRYISDLIRTLDVQNPGAPRADMQQKLRSLIMTLIRKKRYQLNETNMSKIDFNENDFEKDKHNVPKQQLEKLEEGQVRVFLPIMEVSKHYSESDMCTAIRDNLNQLEAIETYTIKLPMVGIRCFMCGNGQGDAFLIRSKIVDHIYGQTHIENLQKFELFEKRIRQQEQEQQQQEPQEASSTL